MNYPINLSFKLAALASQIRMIDASGQMVGFVKQKMFKLRDDIRVYSDESQTNEVFAIKANKVLDFSAQFNFTNANGASLGSVRRKGMRSIWKAHYEIYNGDTLVMNIHEENPWIKVAHALVGELPVVGIFTGYVFNPAYLVTRTDGTVVARLKKQPSFFGGEFQLVENAKMSDEEETRVFLSVLTVTLLEHHRG